MLTGFQLSFNTNFNKLVEARLSKKKQKGLISNGLAKISAILITNVCACFGLQLIFGANWAKIRLVV